MPKQSSKQKLEVGTTYLGTQISLMFEAASIALGTEFKVT